MKKVKRSTFKVLFYLKKNAPKKNGKVAIMGRITIDNQVAQFSTKLEILPQKWDLKYGRVTGKTEEATQLNRTAFAFKVLKVFLYTLVHRGLQHVSLFWNLCMFAHHLVGTLQICK